MRLENLADRFDAQSLNTSYFNLNKFAYQFYQDVNEGQLPVALQIEETDLSGNMKEGERESKNQNIWVGKNDGSHLSFT